MTRAERIGGQSATVCYCYGQTTKRNHKSHRSLKFRDMSARQERVEQQTDKLASGYTYITHAASRLLIR
ncbi:hypothetical protein NDU88_003847 [Pleurodeles waltl]|uniref:Uncharacterized protein n=1 Tax=Pleurodeles waltl TaxID=8319 RepID=A0AAV7W666_PLEWA|nr:hypothetical protein NDU88_003847 [Pleurodeles waltl]